MRQDKAYDYFSAYFEGSLEASLKSQFERVLEANPSVQEDYAAFAASLMSLNDLAQVEVAVPDDLHERISARLDRHIFEQERKRPSSLISRWRQLAIGGVAVIAVLGTVMTISRQQRSDGFGAGTVMVPISESGLTVEADASGTFLRYSAKGDDVVEVRRVDDDVLQKEYPVGSGTRLDVPLTFRGREPLALRISRKSDEKVLVVILPGTARSESLSGDGTVLEFAKTLSSISGRTVLLDSKREADTVRWTINPSDVTSPQEIPELTLEVRGRLIRVRY